jgi:prepilin-type N-terminal cleavage/methylation domain-containing protein
MKLTHTQNMKATKSGMTLLELTVVILVLLSLISILFIGARAWKKGSDRAASILTIRNTQQAVRSFANMNGKNPGDAVTPGSNATAGDLFGAGKFMENNPVTDLDHPAGDTVDYEYGADSAGGAEIPEVGKLYITASDAEYAPLAADTKDW